jgi:hypothetical protein
MTDAATADRPAPPATARTGKGRRWGVRALLCLGTLLAFLSVFAVWANRQLLNADNWTTTSSQLLANPAVRNQVAGFAVDQLYENVDVAGQIRAALPPRLAPLAGPAASGLRDLAERATRRALARPAVQQLWEVANHATATQFIRVAKGESKLVTQKGNAVVIDLRPMVLDLAARLGLPDAIASKLPPQAAQVRIMRADQLSTLESLAAALGAVSIVLPIVSLTCLGLGVLLARGRRRVVLLWAGIDLAVAGVAALLARNVIGTHIVDALASTAAVRPTVETAWSIATWLLVDVAQATIIGGVPVVVAALVAGPSRPATALRRWASPWLRDRPGLTYAAAAFLLLLVVWWGPIPATRKPLPVLVMAALLAVGVEVLRRQVSREFPDVTSQDLRNAMVVRARGAKAALSPRSRSNGGAPADDRAHDLERLSALHDHGALSDAEFDSAKRALLPH